MAETEHVMDGPFTSAKEMAAYWIKRAKIAERERDELRVGMDHIIKQAEVYKRDGSKGGGAMRGCFTKLQEIADKALSGQPSPRAEAERAVVSAAMAFYKSKNYSKAGQELVAIWDACKAIAAAQEDASDD